MLRPARMRSSAIAVEGNWRSVAFSQHLRRTREQGPGGRSKGAGRGVGCLQAIPARRTGNSPSRARQRKATRRDRPAPIIAPGAERMQASRPCAERRSIRLHRLAPRAAGVHRLLGGGSVIRFRVPACDIAGQRGVDRRQPRLVCDCDRTEQVGDLLGRQALTAHPSPSRLTKPLSRILRSLSLVVDCRACISDEISAMRRGRSRRRLRIFSSASFAASM